MKRYIIGLISILISYVGVYAETNEIKLNTDRFADTGVVTYNKPFDYKKTAEWGKYKALRAVGWSTLGIGVPATLTGLFLCGLAIDASPEAGTAAAIVTISGASLTVASIPILITAYHYRNKAKKMALNVGVSSLNVPAGMNRTDFAPALSLALNF